MFKTIVAFPDLCRSAAITHGSSRVHGRRSRGGQGVQVPPQNLERRTLMQMPPQVLSYRYKNERSVALKIRQNPFYPAGGAHDAPPDPLVGWRWDTPPHTPLHSARTDLRRSPCVPPEVQPDLRLCQNHGDALTNVLRICITVYHDFLNRGSVSEA